jgi:hypothetical protein
MSLVAWIAVFAVWTGHNETLPPHVREGDRIEQQFRSFRNRLQEFFTTLRGLMDQQAPPVALVRLTDAAPVPVRYGYGMLPRIVEPPASAGDPVRVFSYSWPITEGYIAGETQRLEAAEANLRELAAAEGERRTELLAGLVREYRLLAANQRTIEQYVQYNRFWQRSIAEDRPRFDQLTKAYDLVRSGTPDIAGAIRDVLGKPDTPDFVQVREIAPDRTVVQVPVYTDIADEGFLSKAKSVIEETWQAEESDRRYFVEVEFRNVSTEDLYPEGNIPQPGDRIDTRAHATRFPQDGAVLTAGAQATHSYVGRYIALGPGDLSARTLAHEFGHILGFRDGYLRGYRDLGPQGFEILELTSVFDDIMSAPREGRVQPAHFKLIWEASKVAGR